MPVPVPVPVPVRVPGVGQVPHFAFGRRSDLAGALDWSGENAFTASLTATDDDQEAFYLALAGDGEVNQGLFGTTSMEVRVNGEQQFQTTLNGEIDWSGAEHDGADDVTAALYVKTDDGNERFHVATAMSPLGRKCAS